MKVYRISRLIVFTICAVLLAVFRAFFVENLRFFIGALMAFYGLLGVTELALEKVKPLYNGHGFLFYFFETFMGAIILIWVKDYASVCIIWAAWSVFRESIELKEILNGELHLSLALLSAFESLVTIVISVLLIVDPGEYHAAVHANLLILEFVIAGISPVFNEYVFKMTEKHSKKGKSAAPEATSADAGALVNENAFTETTPAEEEGAPSQSGERE